MLFSTLEQVPLGHSPRLEVAVIGNPAPSLQWQLNGEDIIGETAPVLTIHNIHSDKSGTYTCRAFNRAGPRMSAPIFVNIIDQVGLRGAAVYRVSMRVMATSCTFALPVSFVLA